MELNITKFFQEAAPRDYSASAAEIGQDAGRITWNHAIEDSEEYQILDTEEKRAAFRVFVRASGGWNDDEIAAWSDRELNALCIQWISGDIRESHELQATPPDWIGYGFGCDSGTYAGRLFCGTDGEIYFYIGS